MPVPPVIAIDGPAASGKTSVGRMLARRLGYRFVDTGLMYRAITWAALERQVPLDDERALGRLAQGVTIEMEDDGPGGGPRVLADGVDVTAHLVSGDVERGVSLVSRVAAVRKVLVAAQQQMATRGGVVMVGRDIGTMVLPNAPAKVYLEASLDERVRRRHQESWERGHSSSPQEVRSGLRHRDELDSGRTESPLRPAGDAVHVATDGLTVEGVVQRILDIVARE